MWFPPSMTVGVPRDIRAYAMTREQARDATLAYCKTWLEEYRDNPRLPYRQTFLRAIGGDLNALRLILTDKNYHTGDNEAWQDAQWPLLNAVGDERFAACLNRLSREDRKEYSGAVVRPYVPESQLEAYARQHFPRVWAIYQREHKKT